MARRRRKRPYAQEHVPLNMDSLASMPRSVSTASGDSYSVSYISGSNKSYTCPGCSQTIAPQTSHVVAWGTDVPFWQESGVEARRHWHKSCWNRALR